MPRCCRVVGCRNGPDKPASTARGELVSYHAVPKDEPRRTRWLNALRSRTSHEEIKSLTICSDHFKSEDFDYDPTLSSQFGFKLKVRRLNNNAVPRVSEEPIIRLPQQQNDQVASVVHTLLQASTSKSARASTSAGCGQQSWQDGNDQNVPEVQTQGQCPGRALQPKPDVMPMSQQTAAVSSRSIAVQVRSNGRSIGTQANTYLKDFQLRSVQVCMGGLALFSTPVKRKRQASGKSPARLPSTPVPPSLDVSPVQRATCRTERSYRYEKRQRSKDTPPRHVPSSVLLSQDE